MDLVMPGRARRAMERWTVITLITAYWIGFQMIYFVYFAITKPGFPGGSPAGPQGLGTIFLDFCRFFFRPLELLICALGGVLCYLLYRAVRLVRGQSFPLQLGVTVMLIFAGAIAFSLIALLACSALHGVPLPTLREVAVDTVVWFGPIGLWTGTALALSYNREVRDREHQLALARSQAQDAQMRALRYQVNPHFLYNTLNSISALILDQRNADAERMVLALSNFFRTTIENDPLRDVDLVEEIALQQLYLEIEQVRFADQLMVEVALPERLKDARVPALILQPLVENALKYGVREPGETMKLRIDAWSEADRLVLEVDNDSPGRPRPHQGGAGIGLANVRNRLGARFGERVAVRALSRPHGFQVQIVMPLEYA